VKNLTLQTCKFYITAKIVVWKLILLSFCKGERIHWYELHRCSGPCRPSLLFTTSMVQVDYEIGEEEVWKLFRTSATDWTYNLNTILHWSPYSSEEDLFDQVCVLPLSSLLCLKFSKLSSVQSGSMMGISWCWVYCGDGYIIILLQSNHSHLACQDFESVPIMSVNMCSLEG